jgi:putative SOS response-associated peptidase YedK
MCGRYTLGRSTKDILLRYGIQQCLFELNHRYNIAPSQLVPVVMSSNSSRILDGLKWGLIPHWVRDLSKTKPLINARAESLSEKPSFKQALARRRCIIPADGFYEWKGLSKARVPMYIKPTGEGPFSFAGLWEQWTSPDGEVLRTCAIITVAPNKLMSEIHNRMPAILNEDSEELWLTESERDVAKLSNLLQSYPEEKMAAYEVSPRVNSPAIDDEECTAPALKLF